MDNDIDIVCAMIEHVAIGDVHVQSLIGRYAPNQDFRFRAASFHHRVGRVFSLSLIARHASDANLGKVEAYGRLIGKRLE